MAIEYIRDVRGLPEVGRRYLVPCGLAIISGKCYSMPLNGPQHADPEIGLEQEHWHYDLRFISDGFARQVLSRHYDDPGLWLIHIALELRGEVTDQPRKCQRLMPEFPLVNPHTGKPSMLAERLEPRYRDVRLKPDCRVCPHRGISLGGLPSDAEGRVVCPGHGLRWNLRTGEMCPRIEGGTE